MEDLIYNQTRVPGSQWRYGFRSTAATGCGWIAAYNVLRLLGRSAEPEKIISDFRRRMPLVNGIAGTFLFTPARWLRKQGLQVQTHWVREDFDGPAKEADACILFYRWIRKGAFGAHFVALHRTEEGFVGYNTYRTSSGPDLYGDSLSGFLKCRKYFTPVLFTVTQRETP